MILIGQYDSPFVRRAAIVLHYHNVPFERRVLSVFADFEAVLAVNPSGKVPCLVLDDGDLLADSRAIIDFVDGEAPEAARLAPRKQPERRRVLHIEIMGITLAEKTYELGVERGRRSPGTGDPAWAARLETQIASLCRWLAARLTSDWFYGGAFSRADLSVAVATSYLARVAPSIAAAELSPALEAHRRRCEALDAFQRAPDSVSEARRSGWRAPD